MSLSLPAVQPLAFLETIELLNAVDPRRHHLPGGGPVLPAGRAEAQGAARGAARCGALQQHRHERDNTGGHNHRNTLLAAAMGAWGWAGAVGQSASGFRWDADEGEAVLMVCDVCVMRLAVEGQLSGLIAGCGA